MVTFQRDRFQTVVYKDRSQTVDHIGVNDEIYLTLSDEQKSRLLDAANGFTLNSTDFKEAVAKRSIYDPDYKKSFVEDTLKTGKIPPGAKIATDSLNYNPDNSKEGSARFGGSLLTLVSLVESARQKLGGCYPENAKPNNSRLNFRNEQNPATQQSVE